MKKNNDLKNVLFSFYKKQNLKKNLEFNENNFKK